MSARMNNVDFWNKLRSLSPQFASNTAKATKEMFTDRGFEQLKNGLGQAVLNDFFELTTRVALNIINMQHVKDPLDSKGFGEYYDVPFGEYIQRMATYSVKPISPLYKKLVDGESVDPFIIHKPKVSERFFRQNFDYQSVISIPDDFQMKQIFISEYGMSEFMAGIMEGFGNGYTIQKFTNKLEALNKAINSTDHPLQETQKIIANFNTDQPTEEDLKAFIYKVRRVLENMESNTSTGAFNAQKYESTQDMGRLKMLIRPEYSAALKTYLLPYAFNEKYLNLDIDMISVPHFGGLEPYKEKTFSTKLYPAYDTQGRCIGFNETENQSTAQVKTNEVFWKDPNEKIWCVIADKGLLFECRQNPYTVEPIRNPAGRYTNYWASTPNNTIAVDTLYNMITVSTQ